MVQLQRNRRTKLREDSGLLHRSMMTNLRTSEYQRLPLTNPWQHNSRRELNQNQSIQSQLQKQLRNAKNRLKSKHPLSRNKKKRKPRRSHSSKEALQIHLPNDRVRDKEQARSLRPQVPASLHQESVREALVPLIPNHRVLQLTADSSSQGNRRRTNRWRNLPNRHSVAKI